MSDVPLTELEQLHINRIKGDIRTSRVLRVAIILFFITVVLTEYTLLNLATKNSNYLKTLVCASDIQATDCPPPDAKTLALTKQLKAAQAKRDAALVKKISTPLLLRLQTLLNRPVQTKVVVVEGATRTIIITRTRCIRPNGKPC